MRYSLPHREIITDSVEAMIKGQGVFDGVVYMASCDKIIPAMLNAAARIDLPSVIVTAGPCFAKIKPSESKELRQKFLRGEITERQLIEGTLGYYTGPGICSFLGTANTMGALCEALGMMLPGGSMIPASTAMRRNAARDAGRAVMNLVRQDIRPSQIMTQDALENTVTLLSAIGGSLNALIHLPALAEELGLTLDWADVAEITSRTPVLCGIVPNGDQTCVDLHYAGGIPAVLKELRLLLHSDCLTVSGKTMGQILEKTADGNRLVIHSASNPLSAADGIQVLSGNLAPDGALVKTSAVPENERVFAGIARVFNNEDDCYAAFREKRILSGDAVIVRYEGPKGGPGMKELHRITEIIKAIPNTAVITDGRFSDASGGLSVGYLCPEAAEGGPIALVKDGDRIFVDLYQGTLTLDVPVEELACRKAQWSLPQRQVERGLLERYSHMVDSARKGATLTKEEKVLKKNGETERRRTELKISINKALPRVLYDDEK